MASLSATKEANLFLKISARAIPEFHSERIRDIASRIDCIGFSETNIPRILVEVVDTVGTLTESLYRLNEVTLVYPKFEEQRFYVVGRETTRNDFTEKIESATFKSLKNVACSFRSYEEIEDLSRITKKRNQNSRATFPSRFVCKRNLSQSILLAIYQGKQQRVQSPAFFFAL
jgi:hypothetical protein